MTTIKIVPPIAFSHQHLYTRKVYLGMKDTANQKWYNRRRFRG